MKRIPLLAFLLLAIVGGPSSLRAAEHSFGLRVGGLQFPDPTESPMLGTAEELSTFFFPPGCPTFIDVTKGGVLPPGCPPVPNIPGISTADLPQGGPLPFTFQLLNDAVHIDRPVNAIRTILDFRRSFESEEFSTNFVEADYEWRRDTEAHFSLNINFGVFATEAEHIVPGNARHPFAGDPLNYDMDDVSGPSATEDIPAQILDRLEFTIYYLHVTPRYNFTTGKARLYAGVGFGLWANLWREVVEAEFQNIFTAADDRAFFRESAGDRRTIIPFSISVGVTYQFLPHWSFNVEDRFLFNADTNVNFFMHDSAYEISGNQVLLGFSYHL